MTTLIQPIVDYAGQSALLTVRQLLVQLGPVLLLAFLLDRFAQFIRARGARIFGRDVFVYLTAPGVMVHELGHAFFCVSLWMLRGSVIVYAAMSLVLCLDITLAVILFILASAVRIAR